MILVAIPFLAFAAALVLAGLSQTFNAQHGHSSDGGFISYWENAVKDIASTILSPLTKAARYVVSRFAASQFRALTAYLTSMAALWRAEFRAMRAEAEATKNVAQALERAIPVEAKKAAAPAFRLAKLNARQQARFRAEVRPAIKHLSTAVDVTIPRDIAGLRARNRALEEARAKQGSVIDSLEHGAADTWDWIKSHPLSATAGLFAGAVSVALSRLGLGWLRCKSNPFSNSKNPCGLLSDLGRFLPALGLLALAFDFPAFVSVTETVATGIGDAVAGIEGVFDVKLPPLPPPV